MCLFLCVSKAILDTTKGRLIFKSINYGNAFRSRSHGQQEINYVRTGDQT